MPGWPWWLRRSHGTEQPQPGYKRKRLYSTLCPSRVPGRALQPLAGGGLAKFQRSASAPAQPARGKPPPRPLQPSGRWASCQRGALGSAPVPSFTRGHRTLRGCSWCPGVPSTPHTGLRGGDPFLPIPSHPTPTHGQGVPHRPPQPHHELAAIPTPPPPSAPRLGGHGDPQPRSLCPPSASALPPCPSCCQQPSAGAASSSGIPSPSGARLQPSSLKVKRWRRGDPRCLPQPPRPPAPCGHLQSWR